MTAIVYTGAQLVAKLNEQFPATAWPAPVVANNVYCAPTRAWVERDFATYYFRLLAARDDLRWAKRGNQCEHFAFRALLEAVDLFGKMEATGIPAEAESLAVAAIKYHRADGPWHEINLWYVDGQWEPWEPQTQRFVALTLGEIATVQQAVLL
ncbi:MAG: hypothetical protein HZA93_24195 [Verrucomicrobia bacterium]|nr:hypothetical protein [Verrucomicrobiota bacterium]